jgi:vacuolar-type H+-ATPase subunit D/Vma8
MSDCIHCDIHDLLEPELAREGADLGQIAAKVTEVLADLVLIAAAEDRAALLADVIANLGHMVLEKGEQPEAGDEPKPRRH